MANREFYVGLVVGANLYHVLETIFMGYFFDLTTNILDVIFSLVVSIESKETSPTRQINDMFIIGRFNTLSHPSKHMVYLYQ